MFYSETTYGKYQTTHSAIHIRDKGFNVEDVKTVNANIRRKVKSGRYIAILDIYPDKAFNSSVGSYVCVYFFDKNDYRFNGKTKDELIHYARWGY